MTKNKSIIRKLVLFFSLLAIVLVVSPILLIYILSSQRSHVQDIYVSPEEVKEAVNTYKYIKSEIFDTRYKIDLKLSENDILVLFKTTSKATPWFNFDFAMNDNLLILSGTMDINRLFTSRYINASCIIIPDKYNSIDSCSVGGLTVPGSVMKWLVSFGINVFFDRSINEVYLQLLRNVTIQTGNVHITASKDLDFKEQSKSGLQAMISTAKTFRDSSSYTLDSQVIYDYIYYIVTDLRVVDGKDISLSRVFSSAFRYAAERSRDSDPTKENEYAIWSVAIAFANPRFSELLKIETDYFKDLSHDFHSKNVVLNSRRDLALHFLYSAILERVGNEAFSNNIGEIKELLDANKGGSGFDISDLAADLSGARFSNFISSGNENALKSQRLLVSNGSEKMFFPNIASYPSAIKAEDFDDFTGDSKNEVLSDLITKLQIDVRTLSLYQADATKEKAYLIDEVTDRVQRIPWANQGVWLSTDTHIHTKHSDGGHTIKEIADKAQEFGCDIIAITDHADGNLSAGSLEYFYEIEEVNRLYPNLSIISGLEWNLSPYKGREHATILFPEGKSTASKASKFRNMFDDYKNSINPLATVSDGLMWLENEFLSYPALPVVFYNHPSRKTDSREEIRTNLVEWSKDNRVFAGFSGAPGHQRMPAEKIGSYTQNFMTSDRWDPVVSEVGGTWDTVLAAGTTLWGARAPSDFHGANGDYWPCQFSETKVYARDNSINGVLEALRRGSFFGSHGKIVNNLTFEVLLPEHDWPVIMGEMVTASEGSELTINLDIVLNERNWKGKSVNLEQVELIVISDGKVTNHIFDTDAYRTGDRISISVANLTVSGDTVIRWRGRSMQAINGDYMFYTNPIVVRVAEAVN